MPSETVVLIIRISAKKRLKKKCLNEKLEALKKLVNCGVVIKKKFSLFTTKFKCRAQIIRYETVKKQKHRLQ